MGKRGRKRKAGPREPNGRLSRRKEHQAVDRGSDRAQAERQHFGGESMDFPLHILRANRIITEAQYDAGCRYAWLYGFVCGRTSAAAAHWPDAPKGERRELPDEVTATLEASFKAAATVLLASGNRRRKSVVDNTVIYGRLPRWLLPMRPRLSDVRDADELVKGLGRLAVLFGYATHVEDEQQRQAA